MLNRIFIACSSADCAHIPVQALPSERSRGAYDFFSFGRPELRFLPYGCGSGPFRAERSPAKDCFRGNFSFGQGWLRKLPQKVASDALASSGSWQGPLHRFGLAALQGSSSAGATLCGPRPLARDLLLARLRARVRAAVSRPELRACCVAFVSAVDYGYWRCEPEPRIFSLERPKCL